MSLISLIVILVIVGVILYMINTQITVIDDKIKRIINWVVVIVVCLWLLSVFGLLPDLNAIKAGN